MTKTRKWEVPANLLVSIRYGTLEECRNLLMAGADSDQMFKINNILKPVIHIAIELAAIDIVELLLKHECSIDRRDSNGKTALHIAIGMGYEQIAEILLTHRADVNLQDHEGDCPLHYAVKRGLLDTAKLLISKGADVCRRNAIGHTPLMCVRYIRRSDFEMMGLLVENGARADDSTLSHLLDSGSYNCRAVEFLLKHGARSDQATPWQKAAFHQVVLGQMDEKLECLDLMLKNGCDINLLTKEKQTPLHLAVQAHDLKIVAFLLRSGANPHLLDCFGLSPLSHAFNMRLKPIIFTLVKAGARITSSEFQRMPKEYFTAQENTYLRNKFQCPLELKELSRIATWKLLGSNSSSWLSSNRDCIPSTLVTYVEFKDVEETD